MRKTTKYVIGIGALALAAMVLVAADHIDAPSSSGIDYGHYGCPRCHLRL